jgi:16S rRNA G527 N7-methylase RsmG
MRPWRLSGPHRADDGANLDVARPAGSPGSVSAGIKHGIAVTLVHEENRRASHAERLLHRIGRDDVRPIALVLESVAESPGVSYNPDNLSLVLVGAATDEVFGNSP